jgi:hypothetical protein
VTVVRAKDHQGVARRARRDAARIQRAWANYAATARALADIRPCPAVWPNSLAFGAPVHCQLLEGHVQQAGTRHRHRVVGTQSTVEWD